MFYREIETDDENSEIKRNNDQDETDDNDDAPVVEELRCPDVKL
jgi:hypothetical protein